MRSAARGGSAARGSAAQALIMRVKAPSQQWHDARMRIDVAP